VCQRLQYSFQSLGLDSVKLRQGHGNRAALIVLEWIRDQNGTGLFNQLNQAPSHLRCLKGYIAGSRDGLVPPVSDRLATTGQDL
jgi:hypothetical protein